jgi:hypothetical protein
MKKLIISSFIFVFSVLVITMGSCTKKGDMGPAGQQGAQGPTGTITIKTDGYIKGTLTGMHRDGTLFTETFNYTANLYEETYIDSINPTQYVFRITRSIDAASPSGARLMLQASSLSPVTIAGTDIYFYFTKSIGAKEFYFYTTSSISPILSNVSYDRTTGIVSGNFIINISGSDNNTGNSANITGSFKATVPVVHS